MRSRTVAQKATYLSSANNALYALVCAIVVPEAKFAVRGFCIRSVKIWDPFLRAIKIPHAVYWGHCVLTPYIAVFETRPRDHVVAFRLASRLWMDLKVCVESRPRAWWGGRRIRDTTKKCLRAERTHICLRWLAAWSWQLECSSCRRKLPSWERGGLDI